MKYLKLFCTISAIALSPLLSACSAEATDPKIESADIATYTGGLNLNQAGLRGEVTLDDNCLAVKSDDDGIVYKLLVYDAELKRNPVRVGETSLHIGDHVLVSGNASESEVIDRLEDNQVLHLGNCSKHGNFWIAGLIEITD